MMLRQAQKGCGLPTACPGSPRPRFQIDRLALDDTHLLGSDMLCHDHGVRSRPARARDDDRLVFVEEGDLADLLEGRVLVAAAEVAQAAVGGHSHAEGSELAVGAEVEHPVEGGVLPEQAL
jgi:hypothetical protein